MDELQPKLDRLDAVTKELEGLVPELKAQAAARANSIDVRNNPEVKEAATNLAQAIAKAQGFDLPLQGGSGEMQLPIMQLPPEFMEYGGIGIGVISAQPTEAARS